MTEQEWSQIAHSIGENLLKEFFVLLEKKAPKKIPITESANIIATVICSFSTSLFYTLKSPPFNLSNKTILYNIQNMFDLIAYDYKDSSITH